MTLAFASFFFFQALVRLFFYLIDFLLKDWSDFYICIENFASVYIYITTNDNTSQSVNPSFIHCLSLFYNTQYNANVAISLKEVPRAKGRESNTLREQNTHFFARLKMQTSCMRLPEGISSVEKDTRL